jgi:putative flippase GtrA
VTRLLERREGNAGTLAQTNAPVQFGWYLIVGGLAFLVDLAVFSGFLGMGMAPVPAVILAFAAGTGVNYVLSLKLAFIGGRQSRPFEFLALVLVSLAGLGITLAVMTTLIQFGLGPVPARMVAAVVALVWNYLGRRLLVFSPRMPLRIWKLSEAGLAKLGLLSNASHPKQAEFDDDRRRDR